MADGERRWAELAARIQDLALPVAERRAALGELGAALRAVKMSPCWGIVKHYRRLQKKSYAKDAQIHVERSPPPTPDVPAPVNQPHYLDQYDL